MITFDTSQLKGRRKIKIDGHVYTVRRWGNLENLEYSRHVRKLQELAAVESKRKLTKAESVELDAISDRLGDMTVALFDDGNDQSMSRALVASLSETELNELLTFAFAEKEDGRSKENTSKELSKA